MRKLVILLVAVLLMMAGWYLYSWYHGPLLDKRTVPVAVQPQAPVKPHLTITAAGDCLMHNTQIWAGQEGDSFNFDHFFEDIKPYLEEGQITSTCFEAPMAGAAAGYTGYPLFNSPDAMADTFKNAGFDIVVTAHNHILDCGVKGIMRTMEVLKSRGLNALGTYADPIDSRKPLVTEVNGIKVGYIAYTYSTNGIPLPDGYKHMVNMLDRDKIVADIKAVRPQVDIVVLALHWGVEYTPTPTKEQQAMARLFLESGADVILGSHPHVIQTMEVVEVAGKPKFVIYGMGNFISHQNGQERNSGIVLRMDFSKDLATDLTQLESVAYTPTFSHHYQLNGKTRFRVVAVEDTIQRIRDGEENVFTIQDIAMLQSVADDTKSRLGPAWKNPQGLENR